MFEIMIRKSLLACDMDGVSLPSLGDVPTFEVSGATYWEVVPCLKKLHEQLVSNHGLPTPLKSFQQSSLRRLGLQQGMAEGNIIRGCVAQGPNDVKGMDDDGVLLTWGLALADDRGRLPPPHPPHPAAAAARRRGPRS